MFKRTLYRSDRYMLKINRIIAVLFLALFSAVASAKDDNCICAFQVEGSRCEFSDADLLSPNYPHQAFRSQNELYLLSSVDEIFANPEVLRGKTLDEVRAAIGKTSGWQEGTLRRGSRVGEGWTLRELTKTGTHFTGRYIQYHPGTSRHFGGMPYWKVSSSEPSDKFFHT